MKSKIPTRISPPEIVANSIPNQSHPNPDEQHLETIASKIQKLNESVETSYLEIGKLLNEAKSQHGSHGDWIIWLCKNTEIRVGTAPRLMRIAREFSNDSPVALLGFSKASLLVPLPENERNEIMSEEHTINGKTKKVEELTKRELERVIRDRRKKAGSDRNSGGQEDSIQAFHKNYKATISNINKMLISLSDINTDAGVLDNRYILLKELCEETLQKIEQASVSV